MKISEIVSFEYLFTLTNFLFVTAFFVCFFCALMAENGKRKLFLYFSLLLIAVTRFLAEEFY